MKGADRQPIDLHPLPGRKLRRLRATAERFGRGVPARPRWLPKRARPFWTPLTKALEELGVLTKYDLLAVAMLADCLGEWTAATAYVEENGPTYTTTSARGLTIWRARPEVAIAADAMRRFNTLARRCGLI